MTANAGLHVIAVDPAYTSRWGGEHWLAPLRERDNTTTGHHAAAVVIGRRAHGHRARRREGVTGGDQRIAARRAAPPSAPGHCGEQERRNPQRPTAATTAAQDRDSRPGPPARPGGPRPFGATRRAGTHYRSVNRNGHWFGDSHRIHAWSARPTRVRRS